MDRAAVATEVKRGRIPWRRACLGLRQLSSIIIVVIYGIHNQPVK
jgi:hypothetical protein